MEDAPVGLLAGAGSAQSLKYVQLDHLGTPRAVIDPSRNIAIWAWDAKSEVFGNSPPNQDPDLDNIAFVFNMRFPGQRHDPSTGLSYNYFRDYDPASGRFVQSDPTGLDGGISSYGYASLDPTSTSDPSGLRGVRVRSNGNGGYTARFDPINTQATATIRQIQSLNPRFQYQSIGPRGQSFTRHDINTLNQIQLNTRAAYQ